MLRIAAALGLTVSIGPALAAQMAPKAAHLRFLGVCILGILIGISACVRR